MNHAMYRSTFPRRLHENNLSQEATRLGEESTLFMIEVVKRSCKLTRPIAVGVSILNISKAVMYELWYFQLKAIYGDRVKLVYTDTDSFIIRVETLDFYMDVQEHFADSFDLSNFPKEHPMYDARNEKVVGKFKIEEVDDPFVDVVAIRPKMYSYKKLSDEEDNRLMGVPSKVSGKLKHELFVKSVYHEGQRTNFQRSDEIHTLRSTNHTVHLQRIQKTSICGVYDK